MTTLEIIEFLEEKNFTKTKEGWSLRVLDDVFINAYVFEKDRLNEYDTLILFGHDDYWAYENNSLKIQLPIAKITREEIEFLFKILLKTA